jgi:head-tail adaptor
VAEIGKYRTRVIRMVASPSRESSGNVTYTYADGSEYWADRRESSASENLANGVTSSDVAVVFAIRGAKVALDFTDMIRTKVVGEEYSIGGIYRDENRNETIVSAVVNRPVPQAL